MRGWTGKSLTPAVFQIAALLLTVGAGGALASSTLSPGAAVGLRGTTAAVESDLAGDVLQDNIFDFAIKGAGGSLVFQGKLQTESHDQAPRAVSISLIACARADGKTQILGLAGESAMVSNTLTPSP